MVNRKNQQQLRNSNKEVAVIAFVVGFWVVIMSQLTTLPDTLVWLVPGCIVGVYTLFRLWQAAITGKARKPAIPEAKQLTSVQVAIQMVTYFALYFTTAGLLRVSLDDYNELFSVIIAVSYFLVVPGFLRKFVWPHMPAVKHKS